MAQVTETPHGLHESTCRVSADWDQLPIPMEAIGTQLGMGSCLDKDMRFQLQTITIPAAIEYAEDQTGWSFIPSIWEKTLSGWPKGCDPIILTHPPINRVLSFQYKAECCDDYCDVNPSRFCIQDSCYEWYIHPYNDSWENVCEPCQCRCGGGCKKMTLKIQYDTGIFCDDIKQTQTFSPTIAQTILLLMEYFYDRGDQSLLMTAEKLLRSKKIQRQQRPFIKRTFGPCAAHTQNLFGSPY